jgi:hypothetical protein
VSVAVLSTTEWSRSRPQARRHRSAPGATASMHRAAASLSYRTIATNVPSSAMPAVEPT